MPQTNMRSLYMLKRQLHGVSKKDLPFTIARTIPQATRSGEARRDLS